jgi:hypothetical protein
LAIQSTSFYVSVASLRPETSNKMIQKGLAFRRERSGTVTVPGAK